MDALICVFFGDLKNGKEAGAWEGIGVLDVETMVGYLDGHRCRVGRLVIEKKLE